MTTHISRRINSRTHNGRLRTVRQPNNSIYETCAGLDRGQGLGEGAQVRPVERVLPILSVYLCRCKEQLRPALAARPTGWSNDHPRTNRG